MPSFTITVPDGPIELDADNKGQASYTVTNTSVNNLRARMIVVPEAPAADNWFTLKDDQALIAFAPNAAVPVIVQIAPPPDTAPGMYAFRLDAVSERAPDEDFAHGSTTTVVIKDKPKRKPKLKLLIPLLALIVLLGIGGTAWAVWQRKGTTDPPPVKTPTGKPDATVTAVAHPQTFSVEAESLLPASGNAGAKAVRQDKGGCGPCDWSGGAQILFTSDNTGQTMRLRFSVPVTGVYTFTPALTRSWDFAVIDLSIDGTDVATGWDGYSPTIVPTQPKLTTPPLALTRGTHTFGVVITGRTDPSTGYRAGIDALTFTPVFHLITPPLLQVIKELQEQNKVIYTPNP